ncbi:MAG: hypothetical protein ONB48_17945 [candidate division KSB1 bacterium]|nr:hypothetical protein [candidate division KSB1 bacterium]MDZ7275773.1 hypothetical protein [candidate division KSB1 bacterium]MDZ7287526.1 hypothetical protein [candidate division KSB1 bacterium]MDZ7309138.1 hypothetical protein [candidate division KSB1 bacterium]MDZ7350504.1 hypothetical protein [candidate division KSB1 bacterium]
MQRRFLSAILLLAALSVFLVACGGDDNPVTPTQQYGSVAGTVTFVGNWPARGEIQVSIWASWPPAGPPSAATLPISQTTTYNYKIEGLNRGTYKAITVGWRDPANPAGARVLGIYINDPNNSGVAIDATTGRPTYATPTAIEISDAKMDHTGLNIKADLAFAP